MTEESFDFAYSRFSAFINVSRLSYNRRSFLGFRFANAYDVSSGSATVPSR